MRAAVLRFRSRSAAAVAIAVAAALSVAGCAGRHRGARTLGAIGAVLAVGGGAAWTTGERTDRSSLTNAGVATAAIGVALLIAAGGWMATAVGCESDPDCGENERCREIPAPPGGVPYKQCMPIE